MRLSLSAKAPQREAGPTSVSHVQYIHQDDDEDKRQRSDLYLLETHHPNGRDEQASVKSYVSMGRRRLALVIH